MDGLFLLIGSITGKGSEGISVAAFDPALGILSMPKPAICTEHPTFLAGHPTLPILYAVNEIGASSGGFVSAFALDPHGIHLLARVPSGGRSPCHLDVDATGRMLVVANYGGPGVASFLLDERGVPHPSSTIGHEGSGSHPTRQTGPHPHAASFVSGGREVVVPDLGIDRLVLYRADSAHGTLVETGNVRCAPGSGPRHIVASADGKALFVIHELSNEVSVLRLREQDWVIAQTISTLPPGFAGENTASEIALHPSGRFLYASNRGADTIALFRVLPNTVLQPAGQFSTRGRTPRHFAIDPSGCWLLVANQDSNNLVIFAIDVETGCLTPHGTPVETPTPTCVLFFPTTKAAAVCR